MNEERLIKRASVQEIPTWLHIILQTSQCNGAPFATGIVQATCTKTYKLGDTTWSLTLTATESGQSLDK